MIDDWHREQNPYLFLIVWKELFQFPSIIQSIVLSIISFSMIIINCLINEYKNIHIK